MSLNIIYVQCTITYVSDTLLCPNTVTHTHMYIGNINKTLRPIKISYCRKTVGSLEGKSPKGSFYCSKSSNLA